MTKLKTLKELNNFVVIKFIPSKEEFETIKLSQFPYEIRLPKNENQSIFEGRCNIRECSGNLIDKKQLKQEAIKWLKILPDYLNYDQFLETNESIREFMTDDDCGYTSIELKLWIKHFFNIMEEDLK